MALKVIYKDIAPGAKEDIDELTVTNENTTFSDTDELVSETITQKNYATLEQDFWKLDGTFYALSGNEIPYISTLASSDTAINNHYEFTSPIVITRVFNNKYSSLGISILFEEEDWCDNLNIKWYNDNTLVADENFTPNSTEYYCEKNIEIFNKTVITFYSMNKPNRFLKVWAIDDGVNRIYTDDTLMQVSILEQMSLISDNIPANTLTLGILRQSDTDLIFQKRQPIYVYLDGILLGVFYIDTGTRESKYTYTIQANCYKGVLNDITYYGGIYNNVTAQSIIEDIFSDEKIILNIDDVTANTVLSGYIPICTKREALWQVLFACCSVCDTSRSNKFSIFKLPTEVKEISQEITFNDGRITSDTKVTNIKLSVHNYTVSETVDKLYEGTLAVGNNLIRFSDPVDTESTVTVTGGTMVQLHNNYCIVNVETAGTVTIEGYKYVDNVRIESMDDPNRVQNRADKCIEVTEMKLVSNSNWEAVMENLYNYYSNINKLEGTMVIDDEKLGDVIKLTTVWSGEATGNIEQLEYDVRRRKIGKVVQHING